MRRAGMGVASVLMSLWLAGCATGQRQQGPQLATATGSVVYALEAPGGLESQLGTLDAEDKAAAEAIAAMEGYPDALSEPPWETVRQVMTQADEAGRRRDMAEQLQRQRAVADFVREHETELGRRIDGNFIGVARNKGCECASDAAGAGRYGLKEALEHITGESNEARNEAHLTITDQESELGKKNVRALREQVNAVTTLSFYLHVARPAQVEELRRRIEELDAVSDTLEDAEKAETARAGEASSRGEKKSSQRRMDDIKAAREKLTQVKAEARKRAEAMEQDGQKLLKSYEQALGKLQDALEARQEAAASKK